MTRKDEALWLIEDTHYYSVMGGYSWRSALLPERGYYSSEEEAQKACDEANCEAPRNFVKPPPVEASSWSVQRLISQSFITNGHHYSPVKVKKALTSS